MLIFSKLENNDIIVELGAGFYMQIDVEHGYK